MSKRFSKYLQLVKKLRPLRTERRGVQSEQLEKRVLFSADVPWANDFVALLDSREPNQDRASENAPRPAQGETDHYQPLIIADRQEVQNAQQNGLNLLEGFDADGFDVRIVEADEDAVAQMINWLDERLIEKEGVRNLHILAGTDGDSLTLGSSSLNVDYVLNNANDIAAWRPSLAANAHIDFYTNDANSSKQWTHTRELIAALTGATVSIQESGANDFLAITERHDGLTDSGSTAEPAASITGGDSRDPSISLAKAAQLIVVTNLTDTVNGDTSSLANLNATQGGDGISLREAILALNSNADGVGPHVINFNVPGLGPHTITLSSALPQIEQPVVIDGSTEPDYAGSPVIVLDGSGLGASQDGIYLASGSGGSTIRGLAILGFSDSSLVIGSGSDGNTIAGNYLGLAANGITTASSDAANLLVLSDSNIIGGSTATDRNVISGGEDGIRLENANFNTVSGNYIGTEANGVGYIGFTFDAVYVVGSSTNNMIGGASAAQGNVIAGASNGVLVSSSGASDNSIQNNLIGVSFDGSTTFGMGNNGISVDFGMSGTVITDNVIAGMNSSGIYIDAINTTVQGNIIGTNATLTENWGTGGSGIRLGGTTTGSTIGGIGAGEGNVIANSGATNSTSDGIGLANTVGTGNTFRGNSIYNSANLGIDLGSDDVSANDAGDADGGSNNTQNWASLISAGIEDGGDFAYEIDTTTLASGGGTYTIDFYANTDINSGNVEGRRYLGSVTGVSDGNSSLAGTLSGITLDLDEYVVLTTTDSAGNTSEFSNNVQAFYKPPYNLRIVESSSSGLEINNDGGNDTYLLADDGGAILGGLSQLSLELQLATESLDELHLISYAAGSNSNEVLFILEADGDLNIFLGPGNVTVSAATFDFNALRGGDVHSLGFTWDNAGGNWVLYFDGAEVASGSGLISGDTIDAGGTLVFGQEQDSVGGTFDTAQIFSGTLHNIRIFSDVRTGGEIASSFASSVPYNEDGLAAQWRFDSLSSGGVVLDDVSGNNLVVSSTAAVGFTESTPALSLSVDETSINGTVVGSVAATDSDREARIATLLAADSSLVYSAELNQFYRRSSGFDDYATSESNATAFTLNGVDGQLATIRSAHEQQLIVDIVGGTIAYLGASDANADGEWRWFDGTNEDNLFWVGDDTGYAPNNVYTNWQSGRPDGGASQSRLTINASNGTWDDQDGTTSFRSVIQWDADDVLDQTDPLVYTIFSQTEDGAFAIDSDTGEITVADGSLLDYDADSVHTLTIRTTDTNSNTYDDDVTITLRDIVTSDSAPTDLINGIEINTDGGDDSYFQAQDGGALLGGLTEFTFETSFQIQDTDGEPTLFSYYSGGDEVSLRFDTNDRLVLQINNVSVITANNYAQLLDGDLHHIAVSWDNTNGDVYIYADGQFVETITGLAVGHTLAGGGELTLGNDQDSLGAGFDASQAFRGTFYDVRIWDEVRSAAEIGLNYQNTFDNGSLPDGLIANWQMNALAGTYGNEIVDVVSGNDLIVANVGDMLIWINQVGGVTASGNTLTYVDDGAPELWGSQINSANVSSLGYTDDYTIRFTLDNTTNFAWSVGLGSTEIDADLTDPEFAIYVDSLNPNQVRVVQNGVTVGTYSIDYAAGDEFGFYVNGTDLEYQHNGSTFATVTIPASTDWYIDSSFFVRTSDSIYNNQDDYSLSNFHIVDGNGTEVSGFLASTPTDVLSISEFAPDGTRVGQVIASDPDAAQDIVSDGGFHDATLGVVISAGSTFGDWSVTQGNIDVGWPGFERGPLGGQTLDLNGNNDVGAIRQTLATEVGRQYQVVFAFSGSWDGGEDIKDVRGSANGESHDFSLAQPDGWAIGNMLWSNRSFTFTATDSSTDLSFESLDASSSFGPTITDIRVIEIPEAVSVILNNDPTLRYDAATDKFYRYVDTVMTWPDALQNALSSNLNGVSGQLVRIDSSYENDLIYAMNTASYGVFIGASDIDDEGEFRWYEGDQAGDLIWSGGPGGSSETTLYTNFNSPPDDFSGNQDYLVQRVSDGQWDDVTNSDTNHSVIEWDASEVLSSFTYALTDDAGGRFAIDESTGEITVADGSRLDHESANSHDVIARVTDASGNSYSESMTIVLIDKPSPEANVPGEGYLEELNGGNPVIHLRFDEGAGVTTYDSAGSNDGTWFGSPTFGQTGALESDSSTAVSFNGSEHIEVPNSTDFDLDEGTFQLWFNTSDATQNGTFFSQDSNGFGDGGHVTAGLSSAGEIEVRFQSSTTDYVVSTNIASLSITEDVWNHFAFSFGGDGLKLYLNGQLVDTDSYTGGMHTTSGGTGNSETLVIGASNRASTSGTTDSLSDFYSGQIDEFALLSTQLSDADVLRLFESANGLQTVDEDATLTFSAANGNPITVTDNQASTDARLRVTLEVDDGVLNLASLSGITFIEGAQGTSSITVDGTESDLNAGLNGLTFTPNASFIGEVNLTVTTSLSADLIALYDFESGALDSSAGQNHPGTPSGDASIVTDATRGNVLSLDGNGDFIEVPGLLGEPENLTIAAWIDLTSLDSSGAMVASLGGSPTLFLATDGRLTGFYETGGTTFTVVSTESVLNTGWRHVAMTIDTDTQEMSIFIDGVAVGTVAATQPIEYDGDPNTFIGREGSGGSDFDFGGQIDDLAVYDRALSTDEIEILANATVSGQIGPDVTQSYDQQSGDFTAAELLFIHDDFNAITGPGTISSLQLAEDSNSTPINFDLLVLRPNDNGEFNVVHRVSLTDADITATDNGVRTLDIGSLAVQAGDVLAHWSSSGAGSIPYSFGAGGSTGWSSYSSGDLAVGSLVEESLDGTGPRIYGLAVDFVPTQRTEAYDTVSISVNAVNNAPTFSVGDGVVTDFTSSVSDFAADLLQQDDGSLIVVGTSNDGAGTLTTLTRYLPDGSIDTSFGSLGRVTNAFGPSDSIFAGSLQTDGRILVSGSTDSDSFIARFNADGSIDTTFGTGGLFLIDLSPTSGDVLRSITVQEDGRIVAVGESFISGSEQMSVVRLNADGTLDTTFNGTGTRLLDIDTDDDVLDAVTIDSEGRIVAAGFSTDATSRNVAVLRFNTDGSLDTTFNGTGIYQNDVSSGGSDSATTVAIDDFGRIVIGGTTIGDSSDSLAMRLLENGSLDNSFNGTGVNIITAGTPFEGVEDLVLQDDGRIVLVGNAYTPSGINDVSVIRLTESGVLDASFDGDGLVRLPIGTATDQASAVVIDSVGNIVVAGRTDAGRVGIHLTRFDSNGQQDLSFNTVNTLDNNPTFVEGGSAVTIDSDVLVFDRELSEIDDFGGATLTLVRNGSANSEDVFSATGNLVFNGGTLELSSVAIGTYTNTGGQLVITFDAGSNNADVIETMRSIQYSNTSETPPSSVQVDWTFNDGNTTAQGSGGDQEVTGNTIVNIQNASGLSITAPLFATTDEDSPFVFTGAYAIVIDDGISGDTRVQVTLFVPDGTLSLNGLSGITFVEGADGYGRMVIDGLESDINTALDGLTFTPDADLNGAIDLDITVSVSSDMTALYDFEIDARDASDGTSYDGVLGGNAFIDSDATRGNVLRLDGNGDFVEIDGYLDEPTSLTYAAWIDATAVDTSGAVIFSAGGAPALYLESDGSLTAYYNDGSAVAIYATENLIDTGWRHVAMTVDTVSQEMTVFIDGVAIDTVAATGAIIYGPATNTQIGRNGYGSDGFDFTGQIDDARIYSRALSADEIAALATDQETTSETVSITVDAVNDAPTFDQPGFGVFTAGSTGYGQNRDQYVLADGSMLILPYDSNGNSALVRLLPDGTIDTTFGTNGYADTSMMGYIESITVQSNGQILVGGQAGANDAAVVRYNADGSLDTNFGVGGLATFSGAGNDSVSGIAVHTDGSITVVGDDGADSMVARFNSLGVLESGFGTNGVATFNLGSSFEALLSVFVLSDGRVVAGGVSSVILLNTSGGLDSTFDGDGILNPGHTVNEVILQADGQIVAVGSSSGSVAVSRFNTSGVLDTGFGDNGVVLWEDPNGESSTGRAIAQQSDGRLVVGGDTSDYPSEWLVLRLNTNGTVDTSFDNDGFWVTEGSWDNSELFSVSIFDNGGSEQIVLGGYTTIYDTGARSTVVRLNPDGSLDTTVDSGPLDGNPTFVEDGGAVTLDEDVTIFDRELTIDLGDDFGGATLTLVRDGGANAEDVFTATGNLVFNAGTLELSGSNIGTYTNTGGQLVLTFASGTENAEVNEVMQSIQYSNTSDTPPASVQINWTFNDQNTASAQGSGGAESVTGSTTVNLVNVPEPAFINVPIAQSVDEDTPLTFSVLGGNAVVIESGSSYDPVVSVTLGVANGTLTLATTTGISFLNGTGDGEATLTISGTESAINTALDGMQFLGDSDYNGSDTLTVTTGSSAATESDLYARYEFLNGSLEDETSNNYDGTANGNPSLTTDAERGDVMTFDGDDRIDVSNSVSSLGDEVSISGWVNLDAGQQDNIFLSIGDEIYILLDNSNSSLSMSLHVNGFTTSSLGSIDNIAGEGWNHIAATINDVTKETFLYLNGVLIDSSTFSFSDLDWGAADSPNITLGALSDGSNSFIGSLDDIRIYNSELTQEEIIATMGDNGFDSETVAITVDAVNDAPVVTAPGSAYTVNEQVMLALHGTGFSVSDVDDAGNVLTATLTVGEGRLLLDAGDSGVTIGTGNSTDTVTITGTELQINALLTGSGSGTIVYYNDQTADSDAPSASTLFTVTVNDGGNFGSDPGLTGDVSSEQGSASQTINITSQNDAPEFRGPNLVTNGDFSTGDFSGWTVTGTTNISAQAARLGGGDAAGPHTLSQTLATLVGETYTIEFDYRDTQSDRNQQLQVTVDGASNVLTSSQIVTDIDGTTYTRYRFTFVADSASSVLTFTDTSDDPDSMSASTISVDGFLDNIAVYQTGGSLGSEAFTEDGAAVLLDDDLMLFDAEIDAVLDGFNNTTLTLVRNGGASNEDEFSGGGNLVFNAGTLELSGANVGSYTNTGGELVITFGISVVVGQVNEVLQSIQYSNNSDTPPSSVQIDWSFDDGNGAGQGAGGSLAATGSTTVNITAANDAPVLTVPAGYTTDEDVAVSLTGISFADDSPGSLSVTFSVTTGRLFAGNSGNVTVSGGGTATLTLTGTAADLNTYLSNSNVPLFRSSTNVDDDATLTVTVNDGEFSDSETALITVNSVNDLPVLTDDELQNEFGTPLIINLASDLLANDSDVDGDTLTITSFTQPANGTIVDNNNGTWTFTPTVGNESDAVFQYTVSDGNGGTATANVVIRQQGIWSINGDATADEGSNANYSISFSGTDDSSVDLSLTDIETTSADYANLVAAINAAVAGRPDLAFDGTTLSYTAPDAYTTAYDGSNSNFVDISGTGTAYNMGDDDSRLQSIGFDFDFFGTTYSELFVSSNGLLSFVEPNESLLNAEIVAGDELGVPAILGFWDDLNAFNGSSDDVYFELVGAPGSQQLIIQYNDIYHFNAPGDNGITFQIVLFEGSDNIEIRYQDSLFGSVEDNGASATIGITGGSSEFSQYSYNTASVASGSSILFTANDRSMANLSFSLGIVDDATTEPDERFSIDLSNASDSFVSASNDSVTTEIDGSDPVTGQPVITGTPTENETLTADTSGIADEDGLGAFSYQWLRDGVAVSGATSNTYTLDDPDVGANMTVTVSYIDGEGNAESTTSDAVGPVAGVNDAPILGNNSLTISEGGTVVLDSSDLSATDAEAEAGALIFTVSGVTNGQFEFVSDAGVVITSFTQAQLTSGDVRFVHNGGEAAPSYNVTVSDGTLTDGPEAATITFTNVNEAPVLVNNTLTIDEDETVVLDSSDLSATDVDNDDSLLTFTVSGVTNGQFELVSNAGVAITTFTQAQITVGDVQFVHDGTENAPAYSVAVSDGLLSDGPEAATITFNGQNDAPVLGNNSLTIDEGETVVLDGSDLSATDVDNDDSLLSFTVSGVTNGQFELVSNAGVAITSFTQAQITAGDVQFVHNGGETAPAYSVTVSDGSLSDG
ncbi:MAG: LamG-like jellyroll fold domain-containing protein, partial [Gammaproteobacteria bacterium]